ncbi:S41 family peptidase [Streptomyces mashuensis]|nr:S41 family peptidase [Streptomyces mashuensis]
MPGPTVSVPPRLARRGAVLTLVFAGVIATGAATGCWSGGGQDDRTRAVAPSPSRTAARPVDRGAVEAAAQRAAQDGKSGSEAAAEVVSRSGDTWSSVYTAREYEGFALALDGAYVGVGITAHRAAEGAIEVGGVRPGGPAERAGVGPGDRLLGVDGVPVTGLPVTEVVSLLRGEDGQYADDAAGGPAPRGDGAGTPVRLLLQRGERHWEVTLRRERLVTESVEVERVGDGGDGRPPAALIKVGAFTRGTGERVREAVRAAGPGEGLLLDLRGNGGGLVTEAVTAASAFLDGGVVATYDNDGRQHALRAARGGDTRRPLVVLVDGGTMSAAELLAGALQDRGRAVVVGSRTFGKGTVQMPSRLPDGSVAELTVGHWRTPDGRAVDGAGIVPDLAVRGDAERRARTVLGGLGGGS